MKRELGAILKLWFKIKKFIFSKYFFEDFNNNFYIKKIINLSLLYYYFNIFLEMNFYFSLVFLFLELLYLLFYFFLNYI
jgi:hypothetical protein